ncbi:hypothetical protein COCC4DRAFT_138399 [Bipolaris maydis ATCC 48331]|uniref:Uncharacterized protein n=2 Tax=Cochliobolus heterostrophus TaxID=5016 RepID=M2TS12_COCH5|nr:uncharacterized protein COCC4DRAFT_138399 [Bipolaris maydis ATCC 48331]EMD89299.1 hypothetical protein COCHEDRAFT_1108814 [Bipolaris maydis C5]ENI04984.1 hypothetical protein COCC4DRAFT_138399 [Bipolaris maydis ATCC 48331]
MSDIIGPVHHKRHTSLASRTPLRNRPCIPASPRQRPHNLLPAPLLRAATAEPEPCPPPRQSRGISVAAPIISLIGHPSLPLLDLDGPRVAGFYHTAMTSRGVV